MMRDDQLRSALDRFCGAARRDGETGHDLRHLLLTLAEKQADVVPLGRECGRSEAFEEFDEVGNAAHDGSSQEGGNDAEEYNTEVHRLAACGLAALRR